MIDHTRITVADFANTKAWYEKVLAAIGYKLLVEVPGAVTGQADVAGFGDPAEGEPGFWLVAATPDSPAQAPVNVGFRVKSRAMVDAFHKAALEAGGADKGEPGSRPNHGTDSYGTFVTDLHGHILGAVCHGDGENVRPPKANSSGTSQHQELNAGALAGSAEMTIPSNVRRFEKLMYLSIALSLLTDFASSEAWDHAQAEGIVGFLVIFLFIYYLAYVLLTRTAVYKRRNWARITLIGLLALQIVWTLVGDPPPYDSNNFANGLSYLFVISELAAYFFSFTGDAVGWFRDSSET
jgi:catechol 2,3-dioxygenase-like lactoylglutathione lyase family enzyme